MQFQRKREKSGGRFYSGQCCKFQTPLLGHIGVWIEKVFLRLHFFIEGRWSGRKALTRIWKETSSLTKSWSLIIDTTNDSPKWALTFLFLILTLSSPRYLFLLLPTFPVYYLHSICCSDSWWTNGQTKGSSLGVTFRLIKNEIISVVF